MVRKQYIILIKIGLYNSQNMEQVTVKLEEIYEVLRSDLRM